MAPDNLRQRDAHREPSVEDMVPMDATIFGAALSHIDADAAEVLTKRLQQLQDRPLMKAVLGSALQQMVSDRVEVDDYEIEYCKVKPWPDINVALRLTLRDKASCGSSRRYVSCTIRPSVASALEQFQEEVSRLKHGGTESPHAHRHLPEYPIGMVREMSMLVRLFPFDPVLTGLGPATDVSVMLALFRTHLPGCRDEGWYPTDLRYEVVNYKPGFLCTLRYTLQLEHPTLGGVHSYEVFGKVFGDDRWKACYEFQTAIWRAACASEGIWRTAKPVVSVPECRFVLHEAVSGQRFRHVFAELTQENASNAELTQAERCLMSVACAVRSMQLAPVQLGPSLDFPALWASQGRSLPYLQHTQPALAKELTRLRKELTRLEATIPSQPLGLAHGDFAHGNVLLDNEMVGIIDFDRGGQAEPAYDVAYFLTHLSSYGIRHPAQLTHATRLCEAFRNAYLSLAPEISPCRLALYEALDLTTYVLRNFRKRSHQAEWLQWSHGQTALAWERLSRAAGDRGDAQ